ncbi:MAG: hypothetical protein MPEBLZ_03239 [Candidatus Methanoperedens nitroreducens]|uniref:Uncharacterized protein n=1 Tax=Candidatus Methanoperedens nitratireducens TaxID=1392998 RepID=A0A0P8C639_9EURY|nr:MAG: hypothetical protein MPEBLZ_03239 [Candidatus Methanoperedens sp. BLZ1]
MKLERKDFKKQFVDFRFYYFFNNGKIEICIVPCVGGFCVEVYDEKIDQLDKECVNAQGYDLDVFGIRPRSELVWNKAIEIANKFLTAYNVNTE